MDGWNKEIRGQVRVGEERGYLFRKVDDPTRWKWREFKFRAEDRAHALEYLRKMDEGKIRTTL